MRSIWKGSISFGLVSIAVKVYSATEEKDIAFHQVHREDGGRIKYKRTCSIDGEEVPYNDIAKGFEFFAPSLISILILVGFFFLVAMVVIVLPTTISMFALLGPGSGGGKNPNPDNVIILVIVMCIEMFIFGVIAACSHALLIFTHLLIIDRKLSGWAAIKPRRHPVMANPLLSPLTMITWSFISPNCAMLSFLPTKLMYS